ncbi:MAG: cytochrome P450 [Pseudomonadota bacterium]
MTKLKKAPSPKGHFLLGHLPEFNRDLLGFLDRSQDYGDIVRVRLAHIVGHIVSHPALAEHVLLTDSEHMVKISQVKPDIGLPYLMGNGLVVSYGDLWRRQRNLINPVFRPKAVEKQIDSMILSGEKLVTRLNDYAVDGMPVDIWNESMQTSLDAALVTMFGKPLRENFDKINNAFTVALHYCFEATKNPFMLPLKWPTPKNRRFHAALAVINNYVGTLIKERQESDIKHEDFLGVLLDATDKDTGKKMSADLIRDEAVTMLGAGHETSAGALTSALIHIARQPEIARRIRQELRVVVGEGPLNAGHIRQLRYLQAVVQETLRLSAPIPLIPRAVTQDTTIHGYHIPAGTIIFVSVYNIHRHKDFWRDADQFNPDRFFNGEGMLQKHRCAYIPFGAGERFCIGSHFGSIELAILLAQVIRNFNLQLLRDTVPMEVAITVRPKGPVYMLVEQAPSMKANIAAA